MAAMMPAVPTVASVVCRGCDGPARPATLHPTDDFEMLMYSTKIRQYVINSARKEITARGEMRSITRAGGSVVEDARHRFIAHARDLDGDEGQPRRDRFDVHFSTAFWHPGNPL